MGYNLLAHDYLENKYRVLKTRMGSRKIIKIQKVNNFTLTLRKILQTELMNILALEMNLLGTLHTRAVAIAYAIKVKLNYKNVNSQQLEALIATKKGYMYIQ